jgi:hypothetical protein
MDEVKGKVKETTIIPRNKYNGRKKIDKAVKSVNILTIKKHLGLTIEVKMRFCSYSNTTYPLRVMIRIIAKIPEMRAEIELR